MSPLATLEAVLFAYGEPISRVKLAALLELDIDALTTLLTTYEAHLRDTNERGLMLMLRPDTAQLVTKPAHHAVVGAVLKEELANDLSQAALETLSLIAYFGPLTRARIEYVRGVNSSFTLRNLLVRGLIERVPTKELGSTTAYQGTPDLFHFLGTSDQTGLPDFDRLSTLLATAEAERAAPSATPPSTT